MSYRDEFPDYDDKEIYIPKGWQDASYHNDTCPHAELRSEDELLEARIWQDYIDVDKREDCLNKRYLFQIVVDKDPVFAFETDDLEIIKQLSRGVDFYVYEKNKRCVEHRT